MSKPIKITQEYIEQMVEDFRGFLQSSKMFDGKVNYSKSFVNSKEEATLTFTETAWLKMQSLVREFNNEVAWHGIACRGDDETQHDYFIDDILVYPQEVTGTTVNTDQVQYQTWLMSLEDDVFNGLRMQGHSHVNMGVTPSGVDNTLYEKILGELPEDDFYIFLIWNKKNEHTVKIYDLKKNLLFETDDVTIFVEDEDLGLEKFMKASKEMVKTKKYAPATTTKKEEKKAEPAKTASEPSKVNKVKKKETSGYSNRSKDYGDYWDDDDPDGYDNYYYRRSSYGGYYYGGY